MSRNADLAQAGGVVASLGASGLPSTMCRTRSSPMRNSRSICSGRRSISSAAPRPSTCFRPCAFSTAAQGLARLKIACARSQNKLHSLLQFTASFADPLQFVPERSSSVAVMLLAACPSPDGHEKCNLR